MNYLSPEFENIPREAKPEVDRSASTATLTPESAAATWRDHFATITREDFLRKVEIFCPELLQYELPESE